MTALVLEWQRVDAVRVGWVPQPVGPAIPAAIIGPPGASGDASPREPVIAPGTTAQYWRGDKSWQPLDKAAVGLGNVNNSSDAAKPVSTAQAAAIALKADGAATTTALAGKQPLDAILTATTASFTIAKDGKLAGIAAGATANDTDANLKNRANHAGTQPASTIGDFNAAAGTFIAGRPRLVAARSSGASFQTISTAFTTLQINATQVDNFSAFNTTTFIYTVPETGIYEVNAKMRLVDNVGANISYGLGIDTANVDSAGFVWANSFAGAATNRQGLFNSRLMSLTAGDQLRAFAFVDSTAKGVQAAELNVMRVA